MWIRSPRPARRCGRFCRWDRWVMEIRHILPRPHSPAIRCLSAWSGWPAAVGSIAKNCLNWLPTAVRSWTRFHRQAFGLRCRRACLASGCPLPLCDASCQGKAEDEQHGGNQRDLDEPSQTVRSRRVSVQWFHIYIDTPPIRWLQNSSGLRRIPRQA